MSIEAINQNIRLFAINYSKSELVPDESGKALVFQMSDFLNDFYSLNWASSLLRTKSQITTLWKEFSSSDEFSFLKEHFINCSLKEIREFGFQVIEDFCNGEWLELERGMSDLIVLAVNYVNPDPADPSNSDLRVVMDHLIPALDLVKTLVA